MNKRVNKTSLAKSIGLGLMIMGSAQASAEVSANVSLVSDYVFRGISQTQSDMTIQGGFDWSHESGFYVGTWASGVDFVDQGPDDGADLELDLYVGYGGSINDDFSYDVSYVQFYYPGTVRGANYNYGEFLGSLGYRDFLNFTLGYSNDVFNSDETGLYYEVSAGADFTDDGWSWNAAVGHYDLDDIDASYTHYSLGVAKAFEKATLALTYHDSNGEEEFGRGIAEDRIVFSISTEF